MTRTPNIADRVRAAMNPEPAESNDDPLACRAYGCPCAGTLDVGSAGRFLCAWHAWAQPPKYDEITQGLRAHTWLLEHIGELQRMQRSGRGEGQPWVVRALEFWHAEPRMQPTDEEARHWNLYLWRLREEVSHRVGLRADAPLPRTRHRDDKRFAEMFRPEMVDGVLEAA